jgi:hypothetical protein
LNEAADKLEKPQPIISAVGEVSQLRTTATKSQASRRTQRPTRGRRRIKALQREYPKFRREDDKLVKIGWSKSERSEYRHRVPRYVAESVLAAISKIDLGKGPFTVEEILPIPDPHGGAEVPQHQIYIAIAWLKAEGVLMQHGRDGYSLLVKGAPEKLLDERWAQLPAIA